MLKGHRRSEALSERTARNPFAAEDHHEHG